MSEIMNFNDFRGYVKENILGFMGTGYENASVELTSTTKNNDSVRYAVLIKENDNSGFQAVPTIYLEGFYEDYSEGKKGLEEVLEEIALVHKNSKYQGELNLDFVHDFESAKYRIIPRLVNREMNKELLKDRPYKTFEDLAITYHILFNADNNNLQTIAIDNQIMHNWGVSLDVLHENAILNLPSLMKPKCQGLLSTLKDIAGGDFDCVGADEEVMFVISNDRKVNGAAAVLDKSFMEAVCRDIFQDKEFYIIPSSVHEMICIRKTLGCHENTIEDIKAMISSVNNTEVANEDILSYNLYSYSHEHGFKVAA